MPKSRIEHDALGSLEVNAERLWGAQTQRALHNFAISSERMPLDFIYALALVKRAAAAVNHNLDLLDANKAEAIIGAADEVIEGRHNEEFPLLIWQSGSGTQTNMNMNEVLANRASELLGGGRGEGRKVHPNDDVNKCQSSNDVIPSAMHISAVGAMVHNLLPGIGKLKEALENKATQFNDIVKVGRTHLQDATPLTLGQEFSGYVAQLNQGVDYIEASLPHLYELAIGGTAVGTGLNAHPEFGTRVAAELSRLTGLPLVSAPNKFGVIASHDALVHAHGVIKTIASSLIKIANDVRWLASGPRGGIGELKIPENEPGSSIMPGKVNPTQSEAVMMLCCQVMGNDVAINLGASLGNFELNTCKPLIIYNFLQSVHLLSDGMVSFSNRCVAGIEADRTRIDQLMRNSLMLVTALTPHIGHDKSAEIAQKAHREGASLRDAAIALGYVTGEQFDHWVQPEKMVGKLDD